MSYKLNWSYTFFTAYSIHKKFPFLFLIFLFFLSCNYQKSSHKAQNYFSKIENGLKPNVVIENNPVHYTLLERMKHYGAIGFSLTTINKFEIENSKGYGYCRKEEDIKVVNNSIFRVGSISKPVTAIVVLKLQEKGILDIDKDIKEYLTTWNLPSSDFIKNTPVTLRNLIQHKSGLKKQQLFKRDHLEGFIKNSKEYSLNEILDGKSPLQPIIFDSEPGEIYKYSNQGYNLIQKVIEDITRRNFEEVAEEIVLQPFKMNNSTFKTVWPDSTNTDYCYAYRDGLVHKGFYENTNEKCGGGLFSTSEDLALFISKVANIINGKDKFLDQKLAAQIFEGDTYGLGFDLIKKDSLFLFSHSGRTSGYYSFMALNPEKGEGFVMLVNSDGVGDLFMEMLRSVSNTFNWNLWNPLTIKAIDIDIENYADYLGTYISKTEEEEYKMKIIRKENKLYYLEYDDEEVYEYPLVPTSRNIFIDGQDGNKIEFNQQDGKEIEFTYDDEFTFTKTK